jgi:hypothetical protein
MSGLNRQLIDRVLGYDDDHHSTEDSRRMNWVVWHCGARPDYILQLATPKIHLRPPANEAEYVIQKIVEATLARMMQPR